MENDFEWKNDNDETEIRSSREFHCLFASHVFSPSFANDCSELWHLRTVCLALALISTFLRWTWNFY